MNNFHIKIETLENYLIKVKNISIKFNFSENEIIYHNYIKKINGIIFLCKQILFSYDYFSKNNSLNYFSYSNLQNLSFNFDFPNLNQIKDINQLISIFKSDILLNENENLDILMNYENLRNNDIFKNENNAINENNEEIINYIFNIIIPYINSFKNKCSFYVINEGNNLNENEEMDKIILDEVIDKCYKDNKIINKISNEDINSILNKYFIYLLDENDYNQFNSLINLLFNHFINYTDIDKNYLINCLIFLNLILIEYF